MPFWSTRKGLGYDFPRIAPSTLTPQERSRAVWNTVCTSDLKFDLLVICDGGEQIWCHQAVLASGSQVLAELLEGQGVMTMDGCWRTEEVTMFMPGVKGRDLVRVLCVLYNGYAKVTVKTAEELKKLWKQLGIDVVRLNNKEKIEVVNIEVLEDMKKNNYFTGDVKEEVEEVKDEHSIPTLEETVTTTPVRSTRDQDLDQSTYFTPGNISTFGTPCDKSTLCTNTTTTTNLKTTSTRSLTNSMNIAVNKSSGTNSINVSQSSTLGNKKSSRTTVDRSAADISNMEEDSCEDPDDPPYLPKEKPRGKKRKSNQCVSSLPFKKISSHIPLPTRTFSSSLPKKTKIECESGSYYVEEIHTCLLCNGKTLDGRVDKEASNLSFREIKRLREHYSKHLYSEGKIFKHFPAQPDNVDTEGKVIDEYGTTYKYNCDVKICWKSKKPACGYKEMALHNAAEHDVLEKILEADERPVLKRLLEQIQEAKEKEILVTKPLSCIFPECSEKDTLFTNHGDYKSLKGHYSCHHWREWFVATTDSNKPRTQRVKEPRRGTPCDVCQVKVFGDENSMIEHYAVVHDQLLAGIMDIEHSGVEVDISKKVILQLFPEKLKEFERM